MKISEENIRLILGLKLRQLRQEKNLSQQELADLCGVSVSYLNEIEKGKKYPKADKLAAIAGALGVPYDKLVSLRLSKQLAPVGDLLTSNFLQELRFDLFGIEVSKVIEIIANAPMKVNAFISTLIEIARNYDMTQERFYLAALRSYQELNENYFEDIEEKAESFLKDFGLSPDHPVTAKELLTILTDQYGYDVDEIALSRFPELTMFRSVFIPGKPNKLLIKSGLSESQKAFVLGREVAHQYLGLIERVHTFTWMKVDSFEKALNNFKASYFSSALLINRNALIKDLDHFFALEQWNGKRFLSIMNKYCDSSQTFMHRITSLAPRFFGLHSLFFLRFNNQRGTDNFFITKELHLSRLHNPHGTENRENYCRRWITLSLPKELAARQGRENFNGILLGVQRSHYINTDSEYFCISIASAVPFMRNTNCSITIGFLMNNDFKKKVKFWNDPQVIVRKVNETCERCTLEDCAERVAQHSVIDRQKEMERVEQALHILYKANG